MPHIVLIALNYKHDKAYLKKYILDISISEMRRAKKKKSKMCLWFIEWSVRQHKEQIIISALYINPNLLKALSSTSC